MFEHRVYLASWGMLVAEAGRSSAPDHPLLEFHVARNFRVGELATLE